jgi:hypothetical protein
MSKLTDEALRVKLNQLADMSELEIRTMTQTNRRKWASGLKIDSNLKSSELAEAIITKTSELRAERAAAKARKDELERLELERQIELLRLQDTPEATKQRKEQRALNHPGSISARVESIFERLKSIATTTDSWDEAKNAIDEIVLQQARQEDTHYTDTSRKSNRSEISKQLDKLLEGFKDNRLYSDLEIFVARFKTRFAACFVGESKAISFREKQAVYKKNSDLTPVKGKALVEKALEILTRARNKESSVRWEEVSLALTLVTGRRSIEIHRTAEFKVDGDKLLFKGQAKARHNEEIQKTFFEIPCLVAPELAVDGLQFIKDSGRYFDEIPLDDTRAVNHKVAKQLERQIANWESIADINWSESTLANSKGKKQTHLIPKNFRDIYATICTDNFRPNNQTNDVYMGKILGHNEGDQVTAQSYQKFSVVDWD